MCTIEPIERMSNKMLSKYKSNKYKRKKKLKKTFRKEMTPYIFSDGSISISRPRGKKKRKKTKPKTQAMKRKLTKQTAKTVNGNFLFFDTIYILFEIQILDKKGRSQIFDKYVQCLY